MASGNWRSKLIAGIHDYDLKSSTGADEALLTDVSATFLSSDTEAITSTNTTLGSGVSGQVAYFGCIEHTAAVAIKVISHADGANQIFTFAAVGDYLVLEFNGQKWETLEKTAGVTQSS